MLLLSSRNSGNISGLAPLRLDLRARTNEPRPALDAKRWCTSVHQLSIARQLAALTARRAINGIAQIYSAPINLPIIPGIPTIPLRIVNNSQRPRNTGKHRSFHSLSSNNSSLINAKTIRDVIDYSWKLFTYSRGCIFKYSNVFPREKTLRFLSRWKHFSVS